MASLFSFTLPKPNSIIKCSSPSSSLATQSPPQLLEEKFGRKGIRFTESGNVDLTVRNGSSLSLRIADGLVTSYKPKVYWKDEGFEEILYTVAGGSDSGNPTKGGVGLVLNNVSESGSGGSACCTSEWVVKDVDSDAIDALQVELSSTNGDGTLEIRYIISLFALSMATAVIVKNDGRKAIKLSSAILTHFKFKSRRGSAIQGLKGCSYCTHPPLSSSFGIMSPADAMVMESPSWFSLGSASNGKGSENKLGSWTVEDNIYTMMKGKLSRVYTAPPNERLKRIYRTPPSKYETIDQGSGLGFRVIRMGYDDIYLASPGSFSQKYGKDYFICTGPASMLVPLVLNPGEEWRGAQVIEHDNL
ncbi:photosynthetic NDH subunit of subcomplex B 2, chloroplastic [Magnolia sinica]|uniref:photosynthetic NDH subunit of subcomplex B 2, chloroplastic n=1 Tax=Magnolia sinica TaxID=86752 RepID=UPI0026586CBE|nr:photosynthetic NDH subunit of subcomplex B 2, chloroplastic [Magnolia sinica]